MSSSPEKLYQFEFAVKSITRCSRAEDEGCGTAVAVRFLEHPEQTVCEFPAATTGVRADGTAAVVTVNRGKTFTFAVPGAGGGCGPKAVPVAVRMYRMLGKDTLPDRVETASGKLDVLPAAAAPKDGGRCRTSADGDPDERTVPMTDCKEGRTVAVLNVRARMWSAGTVTATALETPQQSRPATTTAACGRPAAPRPRPHSGNDCRGKHTKCCDDQQPPPPRTCHHRHCGGCSAERRSAACPAAAGGCDGPAPRQYTNVCCEIDGRKIDMRIRKKKYETCAVERQITNEAEAFASRVMAVVKEMHGLITDTAASRTADCMN